ncbi:MAG: hypothetical protein JWQ02_4273 [Capsulimonas sp.]|jgi:putative membrane protein|nr:hypothetical protein [Capsulimonas sp.]
MLTVAAALFAVASAPAAKAAPVSMMDKTFVKKAAQSDIAEIMTSQLALQRAVDGNVREFAQHMIRDHKMTSMKLKKIAMTNGVMVPMHTDQMHQMEYMRLSKLTGASFDKTYIQGQVKAHKAAVALFTSEKNRGRNGQLTQFAATTLPALKMHRMMSVQTADAVMGSTNGRYAHRMKPMGKM